MSIAPQAKIFGVRLGVDPKILVGALIGVAALLFWYNSRGDEQPVAGAGAHVAEPANVTPAVIAKSHAQSERRRGMHDDRGTLRLRTVDPTHGDIDPVLRLDLLDRLSRVQAPSGTRNLFESGPAAQMAQGTTPLPNRIIPVKAIPAAPAIGAYPITTQLEANIPFKYYGFAKPLNPGEANRGFFMEGDNIMAAAEGQLIQQRYLVVQLTPNTAKLEDTQAKMGKTLQVVPEAVEQGGTGTAAFNQPGANPQQLNRPGMLQPGMNPDEVNQ